MKWKIFSRQIQIGMQFSCDWKHSANNWPRYWLFDTLDEEKEVSRFRHNLTSFFCSSSFETLSLAKNYIHILYDWSIASMTTLMTNFQLIISLLMKQNDKIFFFAVCASPKLMVSNMLYIYYIAANMFCILFFLVKH